MNKRVGYTWTKEQDKEIKEWRKRHSHDHLHGLDPCPKYYFRIEDFAETTAVTCICQLCERRAKVEMIKKKELYADREYMKNHDAEYDIFL